MQKAQKIKTMKISAYNMKPKENIARQETYIRFIWGADLKRHESLYQQHYLTLFVEIAKRKKKICMSLLSMPLS